MTHDLIWKGAKSWDEAAICVMRMLKKFWQLLC